MKLHILRILGITAASYGMTEDAPSAEPAPAVTKESILQRVEAAFETEVLEVGEYLHTALQTIEDWLAGRESDSEVAQDEGNAATDTPAVAPDVAPATTGDTA